MPTFSPDEEQELRDLLILVQKQKDERERVQQQRVRSRRRSSVPPNDSTPSAPATRREP